MPASGRNVYGHRDHVDVYVCVRGVPVPVGPCFPVGRRLFQILLFDDFLAFDHTASAVRTIVLSLLPAGTAAGAGFIIYDLGADDLFPGRAGRGTAETKPAGDPADELYDHHDGDHDEEEQYNQSADEHRKTETIAGTARLRTACLPVRGEGKCIIGISDGDGEAPARRNGIGKDKITAVDQAVRLPGTGFVRVPPDGQILDGNPVKPCRGKGKHRLPLDIAVNLVHVVLNKGKREAAPEWWLLGRPMSTQVRGP